MFASVDVGYHDSAAKAACVTFNDWIDACSTNEYVVDIDAVEPYVPGQFYRRELPCVMSVLDKLSTSPRVIVIDGYVWLDESRKGLGVHLYEALKDAIPIIGVAKTRFATAANAAEIYRGSSGRPLLITSVGMDQDEAADCIRRMHGANRIPTLLKRVDQLSRSEGTELTSE